MIFLFASLALLSLALTLWQWWAARRFPLHQRAADKSFAPAVTLLKPLKGCDAATADCLRSWLAQDYAGLVQVLFGVASSEDPVCDIVLQLIAEFPERDAQLVICNESLGANAKVSKLIQLERLVKNEVIVVSDADVRVPVDLLANVVAPLRDPQTGLVTCFYRLANPATLAMGWEAVAINADFWSQVLQSRSLKPMDFALGAVLATRRKQLQEIGGFTAMVDCLADDYKLGNRIARRGHRIEISPVVVECWSAPMSWRAVWKHQLRWARTIRVCQPLPYFFSILSNATLWPVVWWLVAQPWPITTFVASSWNADGSVVASLIAHTVVPRSLTLICVCLVVRILAALDLQWRLTGSAGHFAYFWLVPVKDLLQAAIWLFAFIGNHIEWRGERFRLRRDGTLAKD